MHQWQDIERPLLLKALENIKRCGATRALDFACGTGRILAELEGVFPEVVGVDVSPSMLVHARARCHKARILEVDLTKSDPLLRVDVATAFRFFLNAEPALQSAALHAIHRELNPGGFLVANIHVNANSVLGWSYRVRNRVLRKQAANVCSWQTFARLLSSHGFAITETLWYSIFPRIGGLNFPGLRSVMLTTEALWRRSPAFPLLAQSFIVVAERRG